MATYTRLTRQALIHLIGKYDLGELREYNEMAGGQANSSFLIRTEKGKFVLSVCDEKSESEIRTLTSTLQHLNNRDFNTSRLMTTREGTGYSSFEGKPVYVKEYLEGGIVAEPSPEMIHQTGQALARLHQIRPPAGLPETFSYGIESFREVTDLSGQFPTWLTGVTDQLKPALNMGLRKGLVHGDLFYDNVLFDQGQLAAILDFEEACHYYLIFDLGMCAAGTCSTSGLLSLEATASLINGYQAVRQLDELEKELLQLHIVYGAAATAFWRFRQFNIIHPEVGKSDHYLEMMHLADHVSDIHPEAFTGKIFNQS